MNNCKVEKWLSLNNLDTLMQREVAAILQTTFLHALSWMRMYEFQLRFHLSLFLRVQITIYTFENEPKHIHHGPRRYNAETALTWSISWTPKLRYSGTWLYITGSDNDLTVRLLVPICVTRPQWVNIQHTLNRFLPAKAGIYRVTEVLPWPHLQLINHRWVDEALPGWRDVVLILFSFRDRCIA